MTAMARREESGRRPLLGILLLTLSLLVGVSLWSTPPWPGAPILPGLPEEACGAAGRVVAHYVRGVLGLPVALWITLALTALSGRALFRRPRAPWIFLGWSAAAAFVLSVLAVTLGGGREWGEIPASIAEMVAAPGVLGSVGAGIVAGAALLLLAFLFVLRWVPVGARAAAERAAVASGSALAQSWKSLRSDRGREAAAPRGIAPAQDDSGPVPVTLAGAETRRRSESQPPGLFDAPSAGGDAAASPSRRRERAPAAEDGAPGRSKARAAAAAPTGPWILPPIDFLEKGEPPAGVDRDELTDTGRTLVRTLADFGISGQLGQIHPGPVVTQYEYEPAAGVKVAQIVSRAEDLALALRASRIRLVAPIPGKAAVGVEVPNRQASTIALRSIVEEIDLGAVPGELPVVLGRDIRGRPFVARLEQMPHLLVAGTTGSGKSVFLNCALLSLLLRRTPEQLRLLLIDPKMLELTPYDGIPHLVCPVVTEARQAARMLTWAVGEMERRYRRLAALGVRNLEGYREKVRASAPEGHEPMPHLVIVVDELADLMLTLANEIEGPIARLAQMARAVGIHLVLATQRPSVDVITGVIKANFPSRIAFQVATRVDSRTILDGNGAESLLGRGDMLFLPPGKAEAFRVHGAYVSERDTEAIAGFLREQPAPPPLYSEEAAGDGGGEGGIEDELLEDALRLVVQTGQASTSFLQRRLKVGYSRAGRLMDLLERAGAVGPQDGSKSREVLADEGFLNRWREEARASESRQPV